MVMLTRSRVRRTATSPHKSPLRSGAAGSLNVGKKSAANRTPEGIKTWFEKMPSLTTQTPLRNTTRKGLAATTRAKRGRGMARGSPPRKMARRLRIEEEHKTEAEDEDTEDEDEDAEDDEHDDDTSVELSEDVPLIGAHRRASASGHGYADSDAEDTDYSEEEDASDEDASEEDTSDYSSADRRASNAGSSKAGSPKRRKKTRSGEARRARGISEDDQVLIRNMINDKHEPAVIINAANYRPRSRRQRCAWTPAEVMYLRLGVERFGYAWADILKCPSYQFHPHRKHIDLKDKWRNITAYRPYGSHGKRTFTLLDENHQPLLRPHSNKPYRFVNRWPRDAALKAASRSEFYAPGQTVCIIYVREVDSSAQRDSVVPPIVHVYEGFRQRQVAPPHLSDIKIRAVWASDVRKIREERFISKEDLQRIERLARA